MSLWFRNYQLQDVIQMTHRYMVSHLGIELLELGEKSITARMPVDERTKMPLGLLHGGASCVLAETLGSYASHLCINPETQTAVGLEINANHIKSASSGFVTGIATPIHVGRSVHVWDIRIENDQKELVCVSRLTMKILDKKLTS